MRILLHNAILSYAAFFSSNATPSFFIAHFDRHFRLGKEQKQERQTVSTPIPCGFPGLALLYRMGTQAELREITTSVLSGSVIWTSTV